MHVPLIDLAAQYEAHRTEIDAAVARVLSSGRYVLGDEVTQLEAELAAKLGRAYAVGVSSGSDALLASLWALGIGPGDEVITTSFSFFATVGAIVRLGAVPVFADIVDGTYQLDLSHARALVTPRTKAFVVVPLFGRPLDPTPLADLGIPIVIDGAQAIGAPHLGAPAIATTLSFFPTKNLGAVGDGGMILTDDARLADKLRIMRQHGSQPKYVHHQLGGNFRLDALQAAILRAKHPHLATWNETRRRNAARYRDAFAGLDLELPADEPGHVYHHFVVRTARRDALKAHLAEAKVDSEVYYPLPLHLQPCFASMNHASRPVAERAAKEVLALPVHPTLSEAQLEHVVAQVRSFHGHV
ncbi:MAG: DegT/DnrJ/EryC1/StrS family aminotransferase [Polyangia bacterium]